MTNRSTIITSDAPQAIGPYAQAIRTDSLVFVSGQIPLDPATGTLVEGGVREQTRRVLENLQAVLQAAGTSPLQVVKTTIFLTDMGDFAAVNEVYGGFFATSPPARSTIQVAALPKGAKVEIEAIALV
jgi:2-iminobutanoate/2-iminopropanoate deaminase